MGNGKIRKWLGISAIAGALIGGVGISNKDQIENWNNERVIQSSALDLEKKIQFRINGSEYKTYTELKPFFIIIHKSFNTKFESDVQYVINAISQILSHIEKKKLEYGVGNDEYNFIIQQYEPDLKKYFRYVLNNLKAKYPQNQQLKTFFIK